MTGLTVERNSLIYNSLWIKKAYNNSQDSKMIKNMMSKIMGTFQNHMMLNIKKIKDRAMILVSKSK